MNPTPPSASTDNEQRPKFLDIIDNDYASEDNPRRTGYFIRHTQSNGQKLWLLTDGKGDFWELYASDKEHFHILDNLLVRHTKEAELRGVEAFITNGWGERCETKDTDDLPDLKDTDPQGRCACCEIWEAYDEWKAELAAPQQSKETSNE